MGTLCESEETAMTFKFGTMGTVATLFTLLLTPACSKGKPDAVKITTADAKTGSAALPKKGIVIRNEGDVLVEPLSEDDVTMEKLAMQVKQERFIIAKPGETVRLYADWSGITVEELKLINDDKLPTFGNKYILSLTAAEFSDFERKRQEYWGGRKKELYDQFDIKPQEYSVKKNDTLDGISRKFDVPLWFLVMHNEALDPYRLSPGTRLIVPKTAKKTEVAEDQGDAQITDEDFKEVYPVIVKKGETVGAYAKWGQISIDDIKRANRHIKTIDRIRVGDTVNLPLTAKQFRRLQELRKAKGK
jgi:LysM repeat protein